MMHRALLLVVALLVLAGCYRFEAGVAPADSRTGLSMVQPGEGVSISDLPRDLRFVVAQDGTVLDLTAWVADFREAASNRDGALALRDR